MSMYNKYIVSENGRETISYSVIDVKTDKQLKDWSGNKLATYDFIQQNLRSLSGRILTIIDASIPEGKQNKCVKDLIRDKFVDEFQKLSDLMLDQDEIAKQVKEAEENLNIDDLIPVSSKDILGA